MNSELISNRSYKNPIFDNYEGPIKTNKKYVDIIKNVRLLFEIYNHKSEPERNLVVLNLKSQSKIFLLSSSKKVGSQIMNPKGKVIFKVLKQVLKKINQAEVFH